VLSGFLITRILAQSRDDIERGLSNVPNSLCRFYLRRTTRIFPPYYLLLAAIGACSLFLPVEYFGSFEKLAYLFYSTNILIASRNDWIGDFGHFWSLAIEEQFYLLFAPLVLLVPRKNTMSVCLIIVLAGVAIKIVLEILHVSAITIEVNSFINFAPLAFGGIIGLSANRTISKWLCGSVAQVFVLCLYIALPTAFGTWAQVWPLFGKLSGVLVGILLFQIFNGQQSWFVEILESPLFRKIGRISYGAYLVHHFVHFSMIQNVLTNFDLHSFVPRAVEVLAELGVSLALATLSWRYVERPIIAWVARATVPKVTVVPVCLAQPTSAALGVSSSGAPST
jgi:peptidoglycan/LPS O-acetylase OafA/YrhL